MQQKMQRSMKGFIGVSRVLIALFQKIGNLLWQQSEKKQINKIMLPVNEFHHMWILGFSSWKQDNFHIP